MKEETTNRSEEISGPSSRKPKQIVQITGLETLQQQNGRHLQEGLSSKQRHVDRRKQESKPNGHFKVVASSTSSILSSLPLVDSHMSDDELCQEILLRNPGTADVFSGNRQWLFDQLGEGTISILKAREIVSEDVLNSFDRVNSSMTIQQLKREFFGRHPSKKKIARTKWKRWFLLHLHEGSICIVKEESNARLGESSRPDSPQGSMANTVSTIPTIVSASTMSTITAEECEADYSSIAVQQPQEVWNSKLMPASKQKYFNAAKVARKRSQHLEKHDEVTTDAIKIKTRHARLNLGNKQKYFNASQVARKNAKAVIREMDEILSAVSETTKTAASEAGELHLKQPAKTPAISKTAKFASRKWLSDVREARKHSRRNIGANGHLSDRQVEE